MDWFDFDTGMRLNELIKVVNILSLKPNLDLLWLEPEDLVGLALSTFFFTQ